MSDTLIKFAGGECTATACGSKNPAVAMAAMMLLAGPEFAVAQAREAQMQNIGNQMKSSGIQVG